MSFFGKIGNGMIVDIFKQLLNEAGPEIFFHRHSGSWNVPLEYTLILVQIRKKHTLPNQQRHVSELIDQLASQYR